MIRTTHAARLALIGLVAAAVAAPGAQAATKVIHADDRADRAGPTGLGVATPTPSLPTTAPSALGRPASASPHRRPSPQTTAPTAPAHP